MLSFLESLINYMGIQKKALRVGTVLLPPPPTKKKRTGNFSKDEKQKVIFFLFP